MSHSFIGRNSSNQQTQNNETGQPQKKVSLEAQLKDLNDDRVRDWGLFDNYPAQMVAKEEEESLQGKGLRVNDDSVLEKEADELGAEAAQESAVDAADKGSGVQKKEELDSEEGLFFSPMGVEISLPDDAIIVSEFKSNNAKGIKSGTIYSVVKGSVKRFRIGDLEYSAMFDTETKKFLGYKNGKGGYYNFTVKGKTIQQVGNLVTALSIPASAVKELGGAKKVLELYKQKKFVLSYNGKTNVYKIGFHGNKYVETSLVKTAKSNFSSSVNAAKVLKGGVVILNAAGLILSGIQAYDEYHNQGKVSLETKVDMAVGVISCFPHGWVVAGGDYGAKAGYQLAKIVYEQMMSDYNNRINSKLSEGKNNSDAEYEVWYEGLTGVPANF